MREHHTCPSSGAMIFLPTEGESALDQIRRLADATFSAVLALQEGREVPPEALATLDALRRQG